MVLFPSSSSASVHMIWNLLIHPHESLSSTSQSGKYRYLLRGTWFLVSSSLIALTQNNKLVTGLTLLWPWSLTWSCHLTTRSSFISYTQEKNTTIIRGHLYSTFAVLKSDRIWSHLIPVATVPPLASTTLSLSCHKSSVHSESQNSFFSQKRHETDFKRFHYLLPSVTVYQRSFFLLSIRFHS